MKKRYYVGITHNREYQVFKKEGSLKEDSLRNFIYVIGPFKTKRGAEFMARHGRGSNPHIQSVYDAERIASARRTTNGNKGHS